MADYLQTNSLEDQLRQDRRLAKAHRRRKRLRWAIPLAILCIALAFGAYKLVKSGRVNKLLQIFSKKESETEAVTEPRPVDAQATLAFVGDIALNRNGINAFHTARGYNFSPCFEKVTTQLTWADLALGNLEGNIVEDGSVDDFNYPVSLLSALYSAGFDVLQTANSYSIQNGISGLERTAQAISDSGMQALGTCADNAVARETGDVLIQEINGIRFAFVAFTKQMNNLRLPSGSEYCVNLLYKDYDTNYSIIDEDRIVGIINQAKFQNPDIIVAMVHWGSEYTEEITDSQKQIADLMIRNGVNLIVGSHSHYVGPMVSYEPSPQNPVGGFVAYGLGDFLSAAEGGSVRSGCILNVSFEKQDGTVRIADVTYSPTYSVEPSEELGASSYEILDCLMEISFYEKAYYDRVSEALYEQLRQAVNSMAEQTGKKAVQIVR